MLEYVDINLLKLNEKNPRYITEQNLEKLKSSLKSFPDMLKVRPVVVDENNVILGGNMRYKASKLNGDDKIWIYRVQFNTEQKNEFLIKDNINYGTWDYHNITKTFDMETLKDWGLSIPEWYNVEKKIDTNQFLLDTPTEKRDDYETENENDTTITFTFNEDIYNQVVEKLSRISSTPEQALYNLLNL